MRLEPVWKDGGNEGILAYIELRIRPINLSAVIGFPAKALVGDEAESFLVWEPGVLAHLGYNEEFFRPVCDAPVSQVVGTVIGNGQRILPLGALGTESDTSLIAEPEGVHLHGFMRVDAIRASF